MGNSQSNTSEILYSVPISTPNKAENETVVYRHPQAADMDLSNSSKIKTLHEAYQRRFKTNPKGDCFGRREMTSDGKLADVISWYSNEWVLQESEAFGSGLLNLGLIKEINEWNNLPMKFCGIYSKNCLEYFLFDIACSIYGIASVPIYDTLGEEATFFAFNQTKMGVCALTANHVSNILKQNRENHSYQHLKHLIVIDPENLAAEYKEKKEIEGFTLWSFNEIKEKGRGNIQPWEKVTPETIYCFSYTSGTTGEPKGAMISQKNMIGVFIGSEDRLHCNANDVYISYLPMAHVLERLAFNVLLYNNVKICVFSGDIQKLKEDLAVIKPTLFLSVPRLFNRTYDAIQSGIKGKSSILQKLIRRGLKVKIDNLSKKCEYKHSVYDKLIFNKMKSALGGNVRLMMTGSAPISIEVLSFLKVAFGTPIIEGYGQTEGTGAEFSTVTWDPLGGHIGGPMIHNEFKLVDVPEMNYTSTDVDESGNPQPRGEIWVRGPNIISGYYKLDEKNKETFTSDGWMMSGDVAMITGKERRVQLIDRKKNIFKLAQGEYIAPEKLENIYKHAHPLVSSVYIYGDSLKSCIVAVLNVENENIKKFAAECNIQEDTVENLAKNPEIKKKFISYLDAEAKKSKLNTLEKVKAVHIETRPFGDLHLLTEAFKLKRVEVKEFYKPVFEEMYKNLI
jgi:long-chain acyl-CoA synthetase